jgi:hypothetical protein
MRITGRPYTMAGTKPVAWWGQERRLNEKTLGLDRQIHIKRERERERERERD